MKISNDESTLTATGWWRNTLRTQQTDLDVDLDVRDAGKYLSRMGLPDAIRGAPTHLRGKLAWAGSPSRSLSQAPETSSATAAAGDEK